MMSVSGFENMTRVKLFLNILSIKYNKKIKGFPAIISVVSKDR